MKRSLRASMRPHRLASFYPRAAPNLLVLHGTRSERDEIAREFHSFRPSPAGGFLKFDCRSDDQSLQSAVRAWLSEDGLAPDPPALMGDGRGTLFLDAVEALSRESQRILCVFLKRLAEATATGRSRPIGRLIAGSRTDLDREVAAGRFMPQLYDALDKARVELHTSSRSQREAGANGG